MTGIDLITAERQRQIEKEGFDSAHDEQELKRRQHQLLMASRPKRSRKHA